uniref:Hydroxyproline-rich glycoprotein family protein n=1 Tax=Noccaea caerulescens TaxID=107243 RepID=A0A1J3DAC3_NOCCA
MGSEQHRFPQHEQRKRWGGCLGVFSCFKSQKGGKRIVPASRIPEGGNVSASQPNGAHHHQAGVLTNQANGGINPSLLAPPSSPASFTNSALPSTAQSPNNCYLSLAANSPGGPSSSMYATGPYAHETQLVSPPVFSTFTTEPSTAPFTPPPELAHLTTPSSPDVPYARFLTSSMNSGKSHFPNDLQSTYSLYPGSPASSLRSPISRASGDGVLSPQNGGYDTNGASTPLQESNFFCPATFAKFYLDHDPSVPQNGGRLSVSKDSDGYGNGSQNRQTRSPKQDMEELEAYRASFGFSADEIITTSQYVEITDVMDDSLRTATAAYSPSDGQKLLRREANLLSQTSSKSEADLDSQVVDFHSPKGSSNGGYKDHKPRKHRIHADEEALLSRVGSVKGNRSYPAGFSSSDAEIEYRRGRSLREGRENRHRIG